MRKVLGFIGCIVLAGSLFALDYWQGHNNKLTSEQLKQDDAEYLAFLKEMDEGLKKLSDCCEKTADILKIAELKMKIAEACHNMNPDK